MEHGQRVGGVYRGGIDDTRGGFEKKGYYISKRGYSLETDGAYSSKLL